MKVALFTNLCSLNSFKNPSCNSCGNNRKVSLNEFIKLSLFSYGNPAIKSKCRTTFSRNLLIFSESFWKSSVRLIALVVWDLLIEHLFQIENTQDERALYIIIILDLRYHQLPQIE